jgi:hypothetical protein
MLSGRSEAGHAKQLQRHSKTVLSARRGRPRQAPRQAEPDFEPFDADDDIWLDARNEIERLAGVSMLDRY